MGVQTKCFYVFLLQSAPPCSQIEPYNLQVATSAHGSSPGFDTSFLAWATLNHPDLPSGSHFFGVWFMPVLLPAAPSPAPGRDIVPRLSWLPLHHLACSSSFHTRSMELYFIGSDHQPNLYAPREQELCCFGSFLSWVPSTLLLHSRGVICLCCLRYGWTLTIRTFW